jgi:capsular polysaccharide transport system permease protein
MAQTVLTNSVGAGDADAPDRPAAPFALARVIGRRHQATAGAVAVLPEHPPEWSPAVTRRQFPCVWLSFVMTVVLPVAIAAVYYFCIAANQYVAEFRFGLRTAEPVRAEPGGLLQQGMAPLQIGLDSYVVAQYIRSRAIVDDLDRTLDLRRMFSPRSADWIARLHPPVPIEELVRYWRGQVDAFFDPTNGTIVVRVRAFAAHDSLALARGILASSERLVNDLSERARRDAVRDAEAEVGTAERRLTVVDARLRQYRDKEGLIDPRKTADASAALAGRLRDELVRADTQLSTLRSFVKGDAPPVQVLEARIRSLEAQQQAVDSEVTDTETTRRQALSRLMGSYEELEDQRRFAENAYQHALEALDRARISADRQQIYVADFVPPSLPEEALYPRRLHSLGVVFLIAFALWAIGGLTLRSVRDHLV